MAYLCRLGSKKTISTSKNTPKSRPLTCVFHKIIERNVVDTKKKNSPEIHTVRIPRQCLASLQTIYSITNIDTT